MNRLGGSFVLHWFLFCFFFAGVFSVVEIVSGGEGLGVKGFCMFGVDMVDEAQGWLGAGAG